MSLEWKERLAGLVRIPLVRQLMIWAISLTVPKQRIGVAVVAVDDEERVLLLRHVFHPLTPWGLPGGWLNHNEDPQAGALRELREETGLLAEITAPVLIAQGDSPVHTSIVYRVELLPGEINLSSEIIDAQWFAADELPSPLSYSVEKALAATYSSLNHINFPLKPVVKEK